MRMSHVMCCSPCWLPNLKHTDMSLAFKKRANVSAEYKAIASPERELVLQEQDNDQEYVTRIPVMRQRYIPVSKVALIRSLLPGFISEADASNFLSVCSCLESVLHAEHKIVLEELRLDDLRTNGVEVECAKDGTMGTGQYNMNINGVSPSARFQQNIMRVLKNAQFRELSAPDLQLTAALNSDYLLCLPIEIDWKTAFSTNVIIFRRGYATEKQEGLLFGAKIDYLQSLVLRKLFNVFFVAGKLLQKKSTEEGASSTWKEGLKKWLEEPLLPLEDQMSSGDLPIWMASRRAVPRYEAVLSSAGSRGRLIKRLLVWMRVLPPEPISVPDVFENSNYSAGMEPHLRPNYLKRVSMRDIWLPASEPRKKSSLWERVQAAFSVFFSSSTLQEPAFKELVVLHTKAGNLSKSKLELNTYKSIPIPDLKVVFPNKKLSFRILDTVRLDIATIVGLLVFLVNYRFDDFLSSPEAFVVDIVASISLVVFATRVALNYKQTWDRYQLLVNKTLYEKTVASGFGVVHFLIDASEEQQFKESILLYARLLHLSPHQGMFLDKLASDCERFMYEKFKEQIEMPVKDAVAILLRLGLITTSQLEERTTIRAIPYKKAFDSIKDTWHTLLLKQHLL